MHKVIICLCLITLNDFVACREGFGEMDLKAVVGIQRMFCTNSRLCGTNQNTSNTDFKSKLPVEIPRRIDGSCCDGCSCDAENCAASGTCCPDVLEYVPTVSESVSRIKASCKRAQYLSSGSMGLPMFMIRKCPDEFEVSSVTAAETKNKCESPAKYNSLEAQVPVTDINTLVTYQNIFCSRCYNTAGNNTVHWDMTVNCLIPGDEGVLHGADSRNILEAVKKSQSCNIVYTPPNQLKFKISPSCRLGLIKECNVTGRWDVHDDLIEAACQSYTSAFDEIYNNVFCALCNERVLEGICYKTAGRLVPPPFSALLTFKVAESETKIVETTCQTSQVLDKLTNVCRNLTCRFPKTIDQGKCINSIETMQGGSYKIYLKFKPLQHLPTNNLTQAIRLLDVYTKEMLTQWRMSNMVFFYNAYYKRSIYMHSTETSPNDFQINERKETNANKISAQQQQFRNSSTGSKTSQSLVKAVDQPVDGIDYLLFYIKLYFAPSFGNINVSVLDDILDLNEKSVLIHSNTSGFFSWFNLSLEDYGMSETEAIPFMTDIEDNIALESINVAYDYVIYEKTRYAQYNIDWPRLASAVLTEKAKCPLIQLNPESEFSVDRQFHGIFIRNINMSVPMKYVYDTLVNNSTSYFICADIYLQRVEQLTTETEDRDREITPQGIISLVCICLSLLCNVMTLVTFSLFKELRSQPGINNMCLVTCLLVAQCLFEFGHLDTEMSDMSCITIGILTHFFWLMVMFWMNVCSFHMFRVFYHKGEIRRRYSGKCKITCVYLVYSVLMSVVIVVINVVVSMTTSGGSDIGYSLETCYISRPLMVGLVFALPVGIIILINITFYIIVVMNVREQPNLKGVHRNYYKIYAKLSTITGVTWVFGIIFFFTGISVIEYLFIVFNACQGVFIFLAFVLNGRVLKLYQLLIKKKKHTQTNTPDSPNTEETPFR